MIRRQFNITITFQPNLCTFDQSNNIVSNIITSVKSIRARLWKEWSFDLEETKNNHYELVTLQRSCESEITTSRVRYAFKTHKNSFWVFSFRIDRNYIEYLPQHLQSHNQYALFPIANVFTLLQLSCEYRKSEPPNLSLDRKI